MEKRVCKCCGQMAIQESKFDLIDANVIDNYFNDEFAIILNVCENCGCIHYGDVVDFDTDLNSWYKDIISSWMYKTYHKNGLLFDMFEMMYENSNYGDIDDAEYAKNEFYLAFVDYVRTGVPSDVLPRRIVQHRFLNHFETYLGMGSDELDMVSIVKSVLNRPKHFLALFVGYIDTLRLTGYMNFASQLCENLLAACRHCATLDDVDDSVYVAIPMLSVEYNLLLDEYTDVCSRQYADKMMVRIMNDVTNVVNAIDDLTDVGLEPDSDDESIKVVTSAYPNLAYQAAVNNIYSNSKSDIRQGWDPIPGSLDSDERYPGWTPVTTMFDKIADDNVNESYNMIRDGYEDDFGADIDSDFGSIDGSGAELSEFDSSADPDVESDDTFDEYTEDTSDDFSEDTSVAFGVAGDSQKEGSEDTLEENDDFSYDEEYEDDDIPDEDDFEIPDEFEDVPDEFVDAPDFIDDEDPT